MAVTRCGSAHPLAVVLGWSLVIGGLLVGLLRWNSPAHGSDHPLMLYAGASLRPAVEAVAEMYAAEFHIEVQVQYDSSESLLNTITIANVGDLFLPAEEFYLTKARGGALVREVLPLAHARPVIAVRKGNPKNIAALSDFLRPDVAVALASPGAAIGRVTGEVFKRSGEWEQLQQRRYSAGAKFSELGKEPEVANTIKLGAADAGIIWDASLRRYPELQGVTVPLFLAFDQTVAVGVLARSQQPTRALHFARYLAACDRGLVQFKHAGYRVVDGDTWEAEPK